MFVRQAMTPAAGVFMLSAQEKLTYKVHSRQLLVTVTNFLFLASLCCAVLCCATLCNRFGINLTFSNIKPLH
jgi:hypothetical protein